ncbi:hypothetical protein BDF20DRAFT_899406 [Mycotypha africana]|uniref:uncharacterized protein n=1 Tax=Mycotypha africana TaxID=64632 RepID=UPI002301D3E1|nr:uncharacterized protein BDF20DRAFT_899406 [Mycotypha africana]KAI8967809.1 hypothetical protein BDF20DRAFT_899406 [Mycotypha africana]
MSVEDHPTTPWAEEDRLTTTSQHSSSSSDTSSSSHTAFSSLKVEEEEDPLTDTTDPILYRKLRSENLLMRLVHHQNLDLENHVSVMRLSKGVFVHHQWQPLPTVSLFEPAEPALSPLLVKEEEQEKVPMDTHAAAAATPHTPTMAPTPPPPPPAHVLDKDTSIPYSYTFGVRYTNPYTDAKDMAVRGRLPLWIQTLFLSECVRQQETQQLVIQPHTPYAGLFPFAPSITVTFQPVLATAAAAEGETVSWIEPELLLAYEKITMDHLDARIDLFDHDRQPEQQQERKHRKRVLSNMLICLIPDSLCQPLTDLAHLWAASQGIFV